MQYQCPMPMGTQLKEQLNMLAGHIIPPLYFIIRFDLKIDVAPTKCKKKINGNAVNDTQIHGHTHTGYQIENIL